MAWGTADQMYGTPPAAQPTGPGSVQTAPPAMPGANTEPSRGLLANPTFLLVVLVGAAIGLIAFSVGFDVHFGTSSK